MLKPTHGEQRDFVSDEMQQGSSSVMLRRHLGACCFIVCWKEREDLLCEKEFGGWWGGQTLKSGLFGPSIQRLLMPQHECGSKRISWPWMIFFGTSALLCSARWRADENGSSCICLKTLSVLFLCAQQDPWPADLLSNYANLEFMNVPKVKCYLICLCTVCSMFSMHGILYHIYVCVRVW